jgi:eukaryotic-like serine/threonine-protein kinase
MVLANGRDLVKVFDFGLAKSLSTENPGGTVTGAGALLGTPAFMPPEVAKGLAADSRADLYSLGCMMYVMGTGHPPFVTDSFLEMVAMHGSQPAPPMTGVPEEIAAVVDRLLQKDPDLRYPTATAVRSALEDAYELTRTSRQVIATPASSTLSVEPHAPRDRGDATTPDHADDTLREPGAPSSGVAQPEVPPNRRARPRRVWRVAIMLGIASAGAVALDRSSSLPDPDRPQGGPISEPAPPSQPPAPPSQPPAPPSQPPAPPSQPPAPPAVDHAIAPPSLPEPHHTVPDPVTKRRGDRPTKRRKPGAAIKTITVPTPGDPQPPTPSDAGSGSGARPGAGSNAPF